MCGGENKIKIMTKQKQSALSKLSSKIAAKAKRSILKNKISKNTTRKIKSAKIPRMGAVATIDTAPVSIGNSIRGSAMQSQRAANGARVMGRDFCFSAVGTGSIATWVENGGTPLTPAAFVDSKIRSYLQLYQKYRWRRCTVHYITSSSTSTTGDVLFYYNKNRDSVFLNQTSNLLLPFVMSDPSTVLGPQWVNHSAELQITGTWKSTDYGMTNDINEYADGEIFLLSKTGSTSTDSPGYVLMDYEIEFAQEQVSPRLLTLPLARIQYTNVPWGLASNVTAGNQVQLTIKGNNIGGVVGTLPADWEKGDIFKIHMDITNSVFTTGTASTLFSVQTGPTNFSALNLTDGFTCYAVVESTSPSALNLYPNSASAFDAGAGSFAYQNTIVGANFYINMWFSWIGQLGAKNFVSNYG